MTSLIYNLFNYKFLLPVLIMTSLLFLFIQAHCGIILLA